MGGAAYGVQCWRLVVIDDTGFPKKGIHSVGVTRLWLPVPSINTAYQRSLENSFSRNGTTQLTQDGQHGAKMLYVEFSANEAKPFVLLISRVQTQNRAVDWSQKTAAAEDADTLRYFTQPSAFIQTDGIVRKTAWRPPRVPEPMLKKPRKFTTGLSPIPTANPRCAAAAKATSRPCWKLPTWSAMAYNTASDVLLPKSSGRKVYFFMYPVAENSAGRIDSYAPDDFKYQITATEIKA